MDFTTSIFDRLRPRLEGIAYCILGSVSESKDVVQTVWLLWNEANQASLGNPEAWLVAITTQISIDRTRAATVGREPYVADLLQEPAPAESPATPEQGDAFCHGVYATFLSVLERLPPEARVAILLLELFDANYDEVAHVIGKSEAACRELMHRARTLLREERPVCRVPNEAQQQLMLRFAYAVAQGNLVPLALMLDDEATLARDGGGLATIFSKPIIGGWRVARFLCAEPRHYGNALRIELTMIDRKYVVLRYINGNLKSAYCCETNGERVVHIQEQRNQKKLDKLVAAVTHGRAMLAICDHNGMRLARK